MQQTLKPQDVVILLKIIALNNEKWHQKPLADSLNMSQSEVSQSIARSKYSGLLDDGAKKVNRLALIEFLQFGLPYVFPQKPGAIVRGIPTAHSAEPLESMIKSDEKYVWKSSKGKIKGQSIEPLYRSVILNIDQDNKFYELLALTDALRVGRAREKNIAIEELKKRILYDK